MKIVTTFLFVLLVLLYTSITADAKEWRGIVPLRSTRADVERMLGRPPDPYDEIFGPPQDSDDYYHKYAPLVYTYSLETEEVRITFSSLGSPMECVTRLPIRTVLGIMIRPKAELHLSDTQISEWKLTSLDSPIPTDTGYERYGNQEEGVIVRTFDRRITEIHYVASAADRRLCPDLYEDTEGSASSNSFRGLIDLKGWRGIVPLHSTRADVERLLGRATNDYRFESTYHRDDLNVIFTYSSGYCKSGWKVPPETVTWITVYPRARLRLLDLKIDASKFKKSQGGHIEGAVFYENEEGLRLIVYEGWVNSFLYGPAAREEHLRCAK